jgi:hypothetical protein
VLGWVAGQGNRVKAFAPVSWQGLALPPTTFCADPNKVVGDRAWPGHDTRGKACLCDVHPIALGRRIPSVAARADQYRVNVWI